MDNLTSAIARVVAGDMNCMSTVLAASHYALSEAAATLPQLVVSRFSLAKVLRDWRSGLFSAQDIQRWASFVRRGYVSGEVSGAKRPIRIEYDPTDEVVIVDIIGRLDEIGDEIDGHVDPSELDGMLRVLGQ